MYRLTFAQKLYHILRIAAAMCFIGHGAFGIITKQIWCNYFGVFGIQEKSAYELMPVVGIMDIALGIVLLVYPMRFAAAWLVIWGLFTAMLRPLSGEPFAELIERAGNYGAPFILLLLTGGLQQLTVKDWFTKLAPPQQLSDKNLKYITTSLKVTGFLILCGHGWLNLILKKGLLNQYTGLGFNNPIQVAQIVGAFEILGAISLLIKPIRSLIFALFIWKVASELLYPQYGVLEWVERGGSYGVLLALWVALGKYNALNIPRVLNAAPNYPA